MTAVRRAHIAAMPQFFNVLCGTAMIRFSVGVVLSCMLRDTCLMHSVVAGCSCRVCVGGGMASVPYVLHFAVSGDVSELNRACALRFLIRVTSASFSVQLLRMCY